MDTTERITRLCDADESLVNPFVLADRKLVSIGLLQTEYQLLELAKKAAISFQSAVKKMFYQLSKAVNEVFASNESMKSLAEYFESIIELTSNNEPELSKWRIKARHNDYPKICYLPLLRRMRCRWRQRESHRKLDGLSLCSDLDGEECISYVES